MKPSPLIRTAAGSTPSAPPTPGPQAWGGVGVTTPREGQGLPKKTLSFF